MDYAKKLTTDRELYPIKDLEYSIESDRGRIFSSAAFRRLQKRTQVFALELNASIRSRLTHSLEVAQTARFIAKTILEKLGAQGARTVGLAGLENAFISTAEMTSLLHDIGNPPFGHFGEDTINSWLKQNVHRLFEDLGAGSARAGEIIQDIEAYNGNAQGFRIITKLQRLNLSFSQNLAVLKYTRGAYEKPAAGLDYLQSKPGFYYSERDLVALMQKRLGTASGHRFALAYIMEAADDISYLSADLEDAHKKGILPLERFYELVKTACLSAGDVYLLGLIDEIYAKEVKGKSDPHRFNMFFTLFRARFVRELVGLAAQTYLQNHEAIFEGSFNSSLLEFDKSTPQHKAVGILRAISKKHIYESREVKTLELRGHKILNSILDAYKPLVEISGKDFRRILKGGRIDNFIAARLLSRISQKQIAVYRSDTRALAGKDYALMERYYRVRMVVDYVSAMTDDYALEEYKILSAQK